MSEVDVVARPTLDFFVALSSPDDNTNLQPKKAAGSMFFLEKNFFLVFLLADGLRAPGALGGSWGAFRGLEGAGGT